MIFFEFVKGFRVLVFGTVGQREEHEDCEGEAPLYVGENEGNEKLKTPICSCVFRKIIC